MKLVEYADRDMMMLDLADKIASELAMALDREDRAALAVPGGTTPGPVFDALSAVDLDWARVDVMLTDERWVPEDNPRSNTALLKKRLLTDKAAAARLIPLYGGTSAPEDCLDTLSEGIRGALPLSVVLLGMGEDMHTASLFPGADRLSDGLSPKAPALLPMRAPGADEPRVTLTAPVLNGAMSKHLLIMGEGKRAALASAIDAADAFDAPVKAVLTDMTVHWAA
ncbi:6-phosphogluconolactonase [Aliiroseovarius sediminilitoris]|uniref:6-phosphogluconolactonase n=1 Tax=Aliiroseovarius sediminilitoris TaxID=1173584 RepID=A0A1I0PII7_9RHOB|nr:6-phosphogluconolactonase [Aliiroseovarius sediminilitoris]SEW14025.1 6-phosphogluconolactonase [Aliiroseovarius sediminilitoris]